MCLKNSQARIKSRVSFDYMSNFKVSAHIIVYAYSTGRGLKQRMDSATLRGAPPIDICGTTRQFFTLWRAAPVSIRPVTAAGILQRGRYTSMRSAALLRSSAKGLLHAAGYRRCGHLLRAFAERLR